MLACDEMYGDYDVDRVIREARNGSGGQELKARRAQPAIWPWTSMTHGFRSLDPLQDSGEERGGGADGWKWGWLYVADSDTASGCG